MSKLTHLRGDGNPHMVDVGDKTITKRSATAVSAVVLPEECRSVLASGGETRKGNVLQVARLAGIMAAKQTSNLIPLCHPLSISKADLDMVLKGNTLHITATVDCHGQTGVEMEALTAASVCALTIYDMLKAISHDMSIGPTELIRKSGGKSGDIQRTQK